jgi:uncharacterized cupin superfamily protein
METEAPVDVVRPIRFDRHAAGEPSAPGKTRSEWYSGADGAFRAGIWTSQPGRSEVSYSIDELCVLLEGVVRLIDAAGRVEIYRAGDTFLIPKGFNGVWETVEPVRKFYAVHKPSGG